MAIKGIHGLFYSSDPDATRAFFKDKVRLPGSDVGDGWWIFDFKEGDLGVHPVEEGVDEGGAAGRHDISFYCDDIEGTVKDLKSRGVSFKGDVEDHGYGLVTHFEAPGGITVQLYEPRYQKGASRPPAKKKKKKKKPVQKKQQTKKAKALPAKKKKAAAKKR